MDFKAQVKKSALVLDDKRYEFTFPSVAHLKDVQSKIKDADAIAVIDIMADFLSVLGIPKEVSMALDSDTFTEFWLYVNGSKKN